MRGLLLPDGGPRYPEKRRHYRADAHAKKAQTKAPPPNSKALNHEGNMAGATGLEPAASGVTGRRSNQLSYARAWATLTVAVRYRMPIGVSTLRKR